jgi:plasmid stability protein
MATLYVRNFPDELYSKVKDKAAQSRRSVSAEVVMLVDEALRVEDKQEEQAEILRRIAERRRSYTPPPGATDTLTLLREDRAR